uniref:Ubiquitin-like domain-containing protein n=1 Tax=Alexandrium monilatum TaxID=311494 RepID=A0A7S4Q8V0_9DINO
MAETQWTLKVRLTSIDNEALDQSKKSKWKEGDVLTLQIEPHATVNMFKQRIALIVMAHPKHQVLSKGGGEALDEVLKLQDIEGLANGGELEVKIAVPPKPKEAPVVLSDDEGLFAGEEEAAPPLPSDDIIAKELSDADMDKQGELKQAAQEALEDGDTAKAVAKLSEAMELGGVSAMMVAKRAELLLKQKRYRAAAEDATLALKLNPDSAKAYRARGKARRFLGEYEGSAADFSQAQKIDYDDGVADMHQYVQKRWAKIQLKAKQDAEAAAAGES